jgi:ABC-type branched-subunit amino acid transport system ATPase component
MSRISDSSSRARLGLVRVPDDRALFTTMTVKDNLMLATRKGGLAISAALKYFPQLLPRLKVDAGMLSGGERLRTAYLNSAPGFSRQAGPSAPARMSDA